MNYFIVSYHKLNMHSISSDHKPDLDKGLCLSGAINKVHIVTALILICGLLVTILRRAVVRLKCCWQPVIT